MTTSTPNALSEERVSAIDDSIGRLLVLRRELATSFLRDHISTLNEALDWLREFQALRREPGEVVERSEEIMRHDYPTYRKFWRKYAMGPISRPSCLVCGKMPQAWPPAIQHMELPSVVVCSTCRDAALASSQAGKEE